MNNQRTTGSGRTVNRGNPLERMQANTIDKSQFITELLEVA